MLNFLKNNRSLGVTLPKGKRVHGIEVKKVPIGVYLAAMRELEELPGQIISELFPGTSVTDIMAQLMELTDESLIRIITRLLVIAPEYAVNTLAAVIGADKDVIKNTLTPKEFCDVIKAYWAMNDMTDFFADVSGLIKRKLPTLISGSKNGSLSPKPSASANKAS
jgi:plasmid maintenance system antidote protein VapI